MLLLKTVLTAASLLFTPVSDDPPQGRCTTPEMVAKVFTNHQVVLVKIDGDKLAAFNQAYEAKLGQPAPAGIATLIFAEVGPKTQVLSFNEGNCLVGVGVAPTELIHQLLGTE